MNNKVSKRIDWIDTLRGIAMFFVIWGHSQKNKTFIRKYIYSFHMPLFFFISGLTFGNSDKLPFKEFLKKKIKGLFIPYIVLNIVCYFADIVMYYLHIIPKFSYIKYILGTMYASNRILPIPCGPSWFLLSLLLVDIIFYFFKKNCKTDFELGIVCSICGIISYVNSISGYQIRGPWHIEAVFTGIVFYYIGYLFMKHINKFDFILKDKWRMFFYGLLLGMLGFAGQYINRRVSMDGNLYGSIFLFYFNSLCSISGLILFVNLFLKKSFVFKDVGKKTTFLLGYHNLFILTLKHYWPLFDSGNLNMFVCALIVFIVTYLLSFPVYKFLPFLAGKFKHIPVIDDK